MTILDGKSLSQKILNQIKSQIANVSPSPCLDVILVGDDPSSLKYVNQKQITIPENKTLIQMNRHDTLFYVEEGQLIKSTLTEVDNYLNEPF